MKIAIASDGSTVSGHFGHCESFKIYDIEGENIVGQKDIANPGHKPGFLPKFLHEQGVDCIIVGGMGQKAQKIFSHHNIDSFTGVQGEVIEILDKFLAGTLENKGSGCNHDHHEGGHEHHHHHDHGNCNQ